MVKFYSGVFNWNIIIQYFMGISLITLFAGCHDSMIADQDIVLSVHENTIIKKNIDLRTAILLLNNQKNAPEYALYQLTITACLEAIAIKYGHTLTDSLLQWESDRIDANSLRPDKIKAIKMICNNDKIYKEAYIKESLYLRWLSTQFQWNQTIHMECGDRVKILFENIKANPEIFASDTLDKWPIREFLL